MSIYTLVHRYAKKRVASERAYCVPGAFECVRDACMRTDGALASGHTGLCCWLLVVQSTSVVVRVVDTDMYQWRRARAHQNKAALSRRGSRARAITLNKCSFWRESALN